MQYIYLILLVLISLTGFSQNDTLSLQGAINKALENNYGIIISKKNIDISELNNSYGMAGGLPTVSFSGNGNLTNNYNDNDDYLSTGTNASIDVNWVLFRGFATKIQKQKLDAYENLSEGNLAVTVENTLVDVILSYYNVLLDEKKVEIATKNVNLSKDRFNREEQKIDLGNSVTYNLLQAQNAYFEDKANLMMAETTLKNAVRQLNYLMAAPVNQTYNFISSFKADTTTLNYEDMLTKMKSNNNTLKNQYINLELAKLEVQNSKSGYYPTISAGLSGGYSANDINYNTAPDINTSAFTTGANVGISYNIYKGGTRKRILETARVDESIAEINMKEMEQALENQLAQEFELYRVRKELLVVASENLKAAKLNFELTQQKFQSGAINSFNFRDIQNLYLNSAWSYQSAIYNLIQSYHTLLRLTGGIIEDFN